MRLGTQTLIQALQAIPWAHDSDRSEGLHPESSSPESESEEDTNSKSSATLHCFYHHAEGKLDVDVPLASSIHAIHRPVARSRRFDAAPEMIQESEPDINGSPGSDDESVEDFEATPRIGEHEVAKRLEGEVGQTSRNRFRMIRNASMGTVKIQRRARLAEKLREVFELQGIEEVWAGIYCSYLPLFIYLTKALQNCHAGCLDLSVGVVSSFIT
jgi:sterol 3beta-glucosyltransferase